MRNALVLALLTLSSTSFADGDYEPTPFRLYAGPIVFVSPNIFGFGGNLAFQWYADRRRVFFLGVRAALLDGGSSGYGGVGGFADAELGIRPRLVEGRKSAVAVVLSGGVGGGYISCFCETAFGVVHLALRAGLGFDVGAFTMDALGGVSLIAAGNTGEGAAEAIIDLGVRF